MKISALMSSISLGFLMAIPLSCSAHEVDGKSVEDVFESASTQDIAKLACQGKGLDLKRLIDGGGNVNGEGLDGLTPLMWALSCQNIAGVEALLEGDADPNQASDSGSSPVYMATELGDSKFLKLLIKFGGDVNARKDESLRSSALVNSLHLAVRFSLWENFNTLLENGASLRTGDGIHKEENIAAYGIKVYGRYCLALELMDDGYPVTNEYLLHAAKLRKVSGKGNKECRQKLLDTLSRKITDAEYNAFLQRQNWG